MHRSRALVRQTCRLPSLPLALPGGLRLVDRTPKSDRYFEEYDGPSPEQWDFLIHHLQTPNLTAEVCLDTVLMYTMIAVKHESMWKARMMREDYFPVARLFYCAFMLIHPHFEIPRFWQMGMHILHMLASLNYRPAILTMYRYFQQISRHRDVKSDVYRFSKSKFQELVNKGDANACTWKAVEVWDPDRPTESLKYLDKAMEGFKKNPEMYESEPLVNAALQPTRENVPMWAKLLNAFTELKSMIVGLVVRKETAAYSLRRRLMLDRLLGLDKKAAREPLWTWEGVYRAKRGIALAATGDIPGAVEELKIAADELDQEEGHYALATIYQSNAEMINEHILLNGTASLEGAYLDLPDGQQSLEELSDMVRVMNEEAELRYKRAAQGGHALAAQRLAVLCETRKEDPGLPKRDKETYELAAKEWAKVGEFEESEGRL
ncbi:hypothetical protein B0T20DRAFT_452755 [Sordaria brevicollis]|uniref:Uncharacterized protein n=1 Tax=Sordaria brevicollis TaxID=83679 RepID=A0AAE0PFW1_SORBR|nr:hypothetical protein B0T20DRAFT_452755 [Sordaria brevicollis]